MNKTLKKIINTPSNDKHQDSIKDNNNQNSTSDNTIKEDDKKPTDKNQETNFDDSDTSDIPKLPDKDKPIDTPVAPTQEQLNNKKRIGLQNKYGFTLFYGDEIGDYKPKSIDSVRLTDH